MEIILCCFGNQFWFLNKLRKKSFSFLDSKKTIAGQRMLWNVLLGGNELVGKTFQKVDTEHNKVVIT